MIETTIRLLRALGLEGALFALGRFVAACGILAVAASLDWSTRRVLSAVLRVFVPEPTRVRSPFDGVHLPSSGYEVLVFTLPVVLLVALHAAAMAAAAQVVDPAPRSRWSLALRALALAGAVWGGLVAFLVSPWITGAVLFAVELVCFFAPLGLSPWLVPPRIFLSARGVLAAVPLLDSDWQRVFYVAATSFGVLAIGLASPRNLLLESWFDAGTAQTMSFLVVATFSFAATYVGGVAAVAAILPTRADLHASDRAAPGPS